MLALLIALGAAGYLTVGTICTKIDIKDSIDNDLGRHQLDDSAKFAFFFWPLWLITDGQRIAFKGYLKAQKENHKLLKEAEKEVELLEL